MRFALLYDIFICASLPSAGGFYSSGRMYSHLDKNIITSDVLIVLKSSFFSTFFDKNRQKDRRLCCGLFAKYLLNRHIIGKKFPEMRLHHPACEPIGVFYQLILLKIFLVKGHPLAEQPVNLRGPIAPYLR